MKLVFCRSCHTTRILSSARNQNCACGNIGGTYISDAEAVVWVNDTEKGEVWGMHTLFVLAYYWLMERDEKRSQSLYNNFACDFIWQKPYRKGRFLFRMGEYQLYYYD